jgi:4'-phosphopantetheinyl transferase
VASDDALVVLQGWLSPAEHARAARFAMPALARRYAVGRAALRYVLAGLLHQAPQEVVITRGTRGRPHLAHAANLDFNVSNTRQIALIGVTTLSGARIGVDVEHRDRPLRHEGLARKFCTPAEYASLGALDEDVRRQRFLRLWTCKEAMSKATGDALGAPLRRLDVELEPVLRLAGGPPPYEPAHWSLLAAPVPDDYFASVALWRSGATRDAGLTR